MENNEGYKLSNLYPSNPPEGTTAIDPEGKVMVYSNGQWHRFSPPISEEEWTPPERPIDRVMKNFARTVNNHPDMNVRMAWATQPSGDPSRKNEPDYWAGVAYGAYTKNVISIDEFKEILLALKGAGACSDHFNDMARRVVLGDL